MLSAWFLTFSQVSGGRTWLDVLGQLPSLGPTRIVPSHGPMGDGSLIEEQRGVLQALQVRVRELKIKERSVDGVVTCGRWP